MTYTRPSMNTQRASAGPAAYAIRLRVASVTRYTPLPNGVTVMLLIRANPSARTRDPRRVPLAVRWTEPPLRPAQPPAPLAARPHSATREVIRPRFRGNRCRAHRTRIADVRAARGETTRSSGCREWDSAAVPAWHGVVPPRASHP